MALEPCHRLKSASETAGNLLKQVQTPLATRFSGFGTYQASDSSDADGS
jgi:hypothetical protein